MAYWGYNEGINERPLERDDLKRDHSDPDWLPPFWQRYVGAVLIVGMFLLVLFIAKS